MSIPGLQINWGFQDNSGISFLNSQQNETVVVTCWKAKTTKNLLELSKPNLSEALTIICNRNTISYMKLLINESMVSDHLEYTHTGMKFLIKSCILMKTIGPFIKPNG